MSNEMEFCSSCGCLIGADGGPPYGWQLEDDSIICQSCAVKELQRIAADMRRLKESLCSSPAPN